MKTRKRKKRRRKLHTRKIFLLNSILVVFVFLGIGYSLLSTELTIDGNTKVTEYLEPTLYNVLRKAARNNHYAKEYVGDHHDSFTKEPSQKIYYWNTNSTAYATEINDMNNVIFAGSCWKILRTTDTGGVKLIYNGEPENNQCLNTRGVHPGYSSRTTLGLSSSTAYWYSDSYSFDSNNNVFGLSWEKRSSVWNESTYNNLISKYTCLSTDENGTCSTLYYIEDYYSSSTAYVLTITNNINYAQIGTLPYNVEDNLPSYVGYMYGNQFEGGSESFALNKTVTSTQTMFSNTSLGTSYWYADSISYDSITGKYSLVNPYQVSSTSDYPNLLGKYTFRNTDQNYTNGSVYYISRVYNTAMYYKLLQNGDLLTKYNPIVFGTSLIDNGDGTYTLDNTENVNLTSWSSDYANYKNKYTCGDSRVTCEMPRYTTATAANTYTYYNAGIKYLLGKERNGLVLSDTVVVRLDELMQNSNNYTDYKYTCFTQNATCTETSLSMIVSYSGNGYSYASNRYYGESVTWDGTNYTLVNPIEIENYNNSNSLATHHYSCLGIGEKVCSAVRYYYYAPSSNQTGNYIILTNGVTTGEQALTEMLTNNSHDSTIKKAIDAWYLNNMVVDQFSIEDTIYCNDRGIKNISGWNDQNNWSLAKLEFNYYNEPSSPTIDFSCENVSDQFSVSNPDARLSAKIGLPTIMEMNALENAMLRRTGTTYWTMSPSYFDVNAVNRSVASDGLVTEGNHYVRGVRGIRPVISLKPGTVYVGGTGAMIDPYVVVTFPVG